MIKSYLVCPALYFFASLKVGDTASPASLGSPKTPSFSSNGPSIVGSSYFLNITLPHKFTDMEKHSMRRFIHLYQQQLSFILALLQTNLNNNNSANGGTININDLNGIFNELWPALRCLFDRDFTAASPMATPPNTGSPENDYSEDTSNRMPSASSPISTLTISMDQNNNAQMAMPTDRAGEVGTPVELYS